MKPFWTLDQVVEQLTRFGFSYAPNSLYFSFPNSIPAEFQSDPHPDVRNFSPFDPVMRDAVRLAIAHIAEITNLQLVEIPDDGQVNNRLVFGHWSYPASMGRPRYVAPGVPEGGAVFLQTNLVDDESVNFMPGERWYWLLLHEIAHVLGIAHPADYDIETEEPFGYQSQAIYFQDSMQYTVMSYFGSPATGASMGEDGTWNWDVSTYLLHDIAALQHLYGANMSTRAGDTVYGFNSNAGAAYSLDADTQPVFSIWDGGGTDTIDLSGYSTRALIDLNQGEFSDAAGLRKNLSIAFGVTIENAVGGSGHDLMLGNEAGNIVNGNGGADRLHGGGGGDIFRIDHPLDSRTGAVRSNGEKFGADYLDDFLSGVDRIDLSGIDAVAGTAANEAFTFIGTGAFGGKAGELRYEVIDGRLHIYGDVDGDAVADLAIVADGTSLNAADFFL